MKQNQSITYIVSETELNTIQQFQSYKQNLALKLIKMKNFNDCGFQLNHFSMNARDKVIYLQNRLNTICKAMHYGQQFWLGDLEKHLKSCKCNEKIQELKKQQKLECESDSLSGDSCSTIDFETSKSKSMEEDHIYNIEQNKEKKFIVKLEKSFTNQSKMLIC